MQSHYMYAVGCTRRDECFVLRKVIAQSKCILLHLEVPTRERDQLGLHSQCGNEKVGHMQRRFKRQTGKLLALAHHPLTVLLNIP